MKTTTLTRRELETLSLIAKGFTTAIAASKLGVSKRTADWHLQRAYKKLDVNSRIQAIEKYGHDRLKDVEIRPAS